MKKENSALRSGLRKGVNFLLFCLMLIALPLQGQNIQNSKINHIYIKSTYNQLDQDLPADYHKLLQIKKGDFYNLDKIKESMKILYSLKSFSDIEVKAEPFSPGLIDIYFFCTEKYLINRIRFQTPPEFKIKKSILKEIIYLRERTYLEQGEIGKSIQEIILHLKSRGFFSPDVKYQLENFARRSLTKITFIIQPGKKTTINKLSIKSNNTIYQRKSERILKSKYYIPYQLQENLNSLIDDLKDNNFFYCDVLANPVFLDPEKSKVNLDITINTGKHFTFEFNGINNRNDIILPIWKKRVSEKWALKETKTRLLNSIKKRGYLKAQVKISTLDQKSSKTIIVDVQRGEKYKLSKIYFEGNKSVAQSDLFTLIKSDNNPSNKILWLNPTDLDIDREMIKIYYYIRKGFQKVDIDIDLVFTKKKVNVFFKINENQRFTTKSVSFLNNKIYDSNTLLNICGIKPGDIFVRKNIDDAIDKIKQFYQKNGYDDIKIQTEISENFLKKITISLSEGRSYKMGNIIIFGASKPQKRLITKLIDIKKGDLLDYKKFLNLKEELESSTIFNNVQMIKMKKPDMVIDVAINVIADDSEYYGIGLGVEKKQIWGIRTTLEYSKKNIFNSYFGFSSMLQLGPKETRGMLVIDSPYFFGMKLNSQFQVWMENEIYPSFQFGRQGIGQSLIKRSSTNSYYLASLSLYRTELTELSIPESNIDRLNVPYNTGTINLSYMKEARDNPFNPAQGYYFLADIKLGLLDIFSENRPFIRLKMNYQKNFPFLKDGVFSLTLRNGLSSNKIPITERFFGGGIYTFRGFSSNKLGPLTEDGEPIGGNAFLFVNCDFTFPLSIIPIKDLYYSLFFDLGNVFAMDDQFNFGNLERACGFELKYKTPFGPFRVSLGYNLSKDIEDKFIFFIGIGNVL